MLKINNNKKTNHSMWTWMWLKNEFLSQQNRFCFTCFLILCERFWKLQPKIFTQFTFERIIWKILNEYQILFFSLWFSQFLISQCSSLRFNFFSSEIVAFSRDPQACCVEYHRRRTCDCNWMVFFFLFCYFM